MGLLTGITPRLRCPTQGWQGQPQVTMALRQVGFALPGPFAVARKPISTVKPAILTAIAMKLGSPPPTMLLSALLIIINWLSSMNTLRGRARAAIKMLSAKPGVSATATSTAVTLADQLFVQCRVVQHLAFAIHDPHRIRRDLVDDHNLALDEADFDLHVDQAQLFGSQV